MLKKRAENEGAARSSCGAAGVELQLPGSFRGSVRVAGRQARSAGTADGALELPLLRRAAGLAELHGFGRNLQNLLNDLAKF